ncbi:MAG: 50S ribosomal protein L4 [Candidatus Liptonbacteria bacterium]|nr:50S ribosomal protein L4 [Candidatus Liptonbacteria bacterium]
MKTELYNWKNEKAGEIELPESVFGVPWKEALVAQALNAQLANLRRPWAHAKGRGEVRGGGKKPWRQKGTGRARHGSIRSPLWIGGGKAHGPTSERDYSQKINKKMKRLALLSILSKKLKDGEVRFFDTLEIEAAKTRVLAQLLKNLVKLKKNSRKYDVLFIPDAENKKIFRAAANLQKTEVLNPESLNVYEVLKHKNVFIDQKAVQSIEKHYSRQRGVK